MLRIRNSAPGHSQISSSSFKSSSKTRFRKTDSASRRAIFGRQSSRPVRRGVVKISQEFIVPDDIEVRETIGEWPEVDEEGVHHIACRGEAGDCLFLSYSPVQKSVRVRWDRSNGDEFLDLFREGATKLTVASDRRGSLLIAEYRVGDSVGNLDIQTSPRFAVRDRLLFA